MSDWKLNREAVKAQSLFRLLGTEAEDREIILASETDFNEVAQCIVARIAELEKLGLAAANIANDYRARSSELAVRAFNLRSSLAKAMIELEVKNLPLPSGSVGAQPGKASFIVTDPTALPERYVFKREVAETDRVGLQLAVARGETIPGVRVEPARPFLTIRKTKGTPDEP